MTQREIQDIFSDYMKNAERPTCQWGFTSEFLFDSFQFAYDLGQKEKINSEITTAIKMAVSNTLEKISQ